MEPHKFSFEGLEVYEKARALVFDVYRIQNQFPKEERFPIVTTCSS